MDDFKMLRRWMTMAALCAILPNTHAAKNEVVNVADLQEFTRTIKMLPSGTPIFICFSPLKDLGHVFLPVLDELARDHPKTQFIYVALDQMGQDLGPLSDYKTPNGLYPNYVLKRWGKVRDAYKGGVSQNALNLAISTIEKAPL